MRISQPAIPVVFVLLSQLLSWSQSPQTASPLPADAADTQLEIQQVDAILATLPDRGAALFLLAHDHAHLGNFDKALSVLKECILLDEGFDPSGDPAFDHLKGNPEYEMLVDRVHRRYPMIHHARLAFTVPEKDIIPEGLVAGSDGTLYMSSLNRHKIVKIGKNGRVSDFATADQYGFGPVCGLKIEAADQSLWANVCRDSGDNAELLHFNRTGKLIERFPPSTAGRHLFNDLVLHNNGRNNDGIYLTDSLANRAYRFDRKSHTFSELSLNRTLYYPNGIAISGDGNLLYIADAFGILQFDLRQNRSHEVDAGPANTVSGIDGLYWYRNSLVAIQNSMGSSRVAQFHLSPDGAKVLSTDILEYRTASSVLPTTGAIQGSNFYFMSNTQVDNFKDQKIVDPAKLEPIRISVVKLR